MKAIIISTILILSLFACTSNDNSTSSKSPINKQKGNEPEKDSNKIVTDNYIIYGQSFGMCEGYCIFEHKVTAYQIVRTKSAWNDNPAYPPKVTTEKSDPQLFSEMLTKVDMEKFYSLEPRIGCPDCTDGGSSWIEIALKGKVYKVTYEFRHAPEPLRQLDAMLRE